MTADELRTLFREPEGETLEFKRNVPKDLRRIADVVAAFANTSGGTLVLGYDEPTQEAVGLSSRRVADDMARVEAALGRVKPELGLQPKHVDVDGKAFIVVEVPEGPDFPYLAEGRVLQRKGSGVAAITPDVAIRRASGRPVISAPPTFTPERPTAWRTPPIQPGATAGITGTAVLTETEHLAEAIAEQSALIERLTEATRWQKQLPLQLAILLAGAILGYLLSGLNPFGFR